MSRFDLILKTKPLTIATLEWLCTIRRSSHRKKAILSSCVRHVFMGWKGSSIRCETLDPTRDDLKNDTWINGGVTWTGTWPKELLSLGSFSTSKGPSIFATSQGPNLF